MFAAISAAREGASVTLLEHNEKLGKKIYITGKGRCNLTNHSRRDELLAAISGRSKFLYSAFSQWDADDTMRFFEEAGLRLKEERGRRVFPASDHASDVTKTLEREMRRLGADIRLNTSVTGIVTEPDALKGEDPDRRTVSGVRIKDQHGAETTMSADAVIVATGGLSYPSTGSTGDGYRFAADAGHQVSALSPSLVAMDAQESWVRDLQGLTLKNVGVRFDFAGKKAYEERVGELLFTHFGISGPAVLTASSRLTGMLYPWGYPGHVSAKKQPEASAKPLKAEKTDVVDVIIDIKPALGEQELDKRLIREMEEHHRQDFANAVRSLFPKKLLPVMVSLSGIDPEKKADQITAEERRGFAQLIKHLTLHATGLRGWNEAVITHGGVDTKQIDPKTMESRLVSGLYFAGEVLNVDAVTGGFNLQIAWSTGHAAGKASAAKKNTEARRQ